MQRKRTRYAWLPVLVAGLALLGAQLVMEAYAPARVDAGVRNASKAEERSEPVSVPQKSRPAAVTEKGQDPSTRFAPESPNQRAERTRRKRGKGHYKHKKSKKHKHG